MTWLRYEVNRFRHASKSEKKQALKAIKNKISGVLSSDNINLDVYCAFSLTVYELDSYKASQKVIQMLRTNFKSSLKLTLTALSIELKECFRSSPGDLAGHASAIQELFNGLEDNMGKLQQKV